MMTNMKQQMAKPTPSFWEVLASTLLSYLGVSSPARRQRDFEHGNPWVFIVMGLFVAIMFIALVSVAVKLALLG
jgi:hypothetical protein